MIWQLVKREAAWRELYGCVAAVALICVVLPRLAGQIFVFIVVLTWLKNRPAERASAFLAGLPISASDLFLSRFLAFLALGWLPAAAGAAALMATGNSAGQLIEAAAAFPVLVLACLAHRVRQLAGSQWAQAISFSVVAAVAWPVSEYVPRDLVMAISATLSALLFAYIWLQLPASFEVAGRDAGLAAGVPAEAGTQAGLPAPQILRGPAARRLLFGPWNAVLRSMLPPTALIFLPVIVFQYLNGQWLYAASMCIFPMLGGLTRLGWSRGLPLARSVLMTLLVCPWMVALLLNLSLGPILFSPREPIQFDYLNEHLGAVRPPLEYWRTAPAGKAPVVAAPWGETWQPTVTKVGGLPLYNPYGMSAENSRQFLEWQYRRATLAIYGQEVAFNDYHDPAGLLPLTRQARFIALNSAIGLCWLLCLVNLAFLAAHWRLRRWHDGAYNVVVFLLLTPMVLALALEFLVKVPRESVSTALLHAGLNSVLAVLPTGVVPVLIAPTILFALLWWSALRLFDGMEAPPVDPTVRA